MSARSISICALLFASLAAPFAAGCAAPTSDDGEAAEVGEDDLTTAAKQLVGTYYSHAPGTGGFAKLKLDADGRFAAEVESAGKIACVTSPCLESESGRWSATRSASGYRLRITVTGRGTRVYRATKTAADLVLVRAGRTQTLHALGANACLDTSDCAAGEECGPKFCLMYCAYGDPFCCGPSTCQPKAPPPPPPTDPCWGAWLDEHGVCRTPSDGAYPDSCCAGQTTPCGDASCGPGTACCNPLAGICTRPDEACAL